MNPASPRRAIAGIKNTNSPVCRASLHEESSLDMFASKTRPEGEQRLKDWLAWACRSRLKPFVRLARTVRKHLDAILAFIEFGLTNARLEGMNNKIGRN